MSSSLSRQLIPSQVLHSSSSSLLSPPLSPPNPSLEHNAAVGHSLLHKPPSCFRVLLQNPNGFSQEHELFSYHLCLENMKSASADVLLFPETNLHWSNYTIIQQATKHRHQVFRFSKQTTSNSTLSYNTSYQPGGTASIITANLVGRFQSSESDSPLGRWSVTHLTMSNNRTLSIICCYRVCNQSISTTGPKTAFQQQWSLLRQHGQLQPNPRRQFIHDLDRLLSHLKHKGHSIILGGDFNSTLGEDATGLDSIILKHQLVDTIALLHGSYSCSTFARGTKCIDYIFISSDLAPSVSQSGIPGFDSVTMSDHRPIFVDFHIPTAFGASVPTLVTPPNRRLFSNDQGRCDRYVTSLHQALLRHNVFARVSQLQSLSPDDPTASLLCESIDRDVTRLMIASEKKLKKPSPTPFSSVLSQACIKVALLKLQYRVLEHSCDKTRAIEHLQTRLHNPITLPNTIQDLKSQLKQLRREVKQIRRDAIQHREDFLATLALSKDVAKFIKHIRKAEEMRRGFSKIKFATKPNVHSMVTQLDVPADGLPPKQAQQWRRITDPIEVTEHLIRRNTNHFGSANGTPFTVPPLSHHYDWSITSPSYHHTLNGRPPIVSNPRITSLLRGLARRTSPTRSTLTISELISRLRKWKETTTTSPSRRHLGHYKALLPPHRYDPTEYVTTPAGQILEVHRALLNFCASSGYSLHRWSTITTMMIPKEASNLRIHRLRVIHLYEADLTALCSIWSKRMIRASTQNNTLHSGSFGARPGRTSTDPPFICLLQTEIAALSRTSLGIGPNDAAQCYDRLIPNQSMLSCMSHGMSLPAAQCIGNTLLHARYYLRTALSQSQSFWAHSAQTPIFGTGQGSGISPGVCCAVYSDLFHLHSKLTPGATYQSPLPIYPTTTTLHNVGFVDDTTTTVTDQSLPQALSLISLRTQLQHSLQQWANVLHLSGGSLELNKTVAYLLSWKFRSDGHPFLSDVSHRSLTLYDPATNRMHHVPISSPHDAFKILGFHLSPSQQMYTQYTTLLSKAHRLALAIAGSSVTFREAFLAYFSVFLPAVSYVYPLTTFNTKQCHRLQVLPTRVFLSKCGFSSTMHRSIVFSPRSSGGLGFRHPRIEQGISQVLKFIQSMRTPGLPKDCLNIAIHTWHINSGVSFDLLEHTTRVCPHLEGTWLTSLRQFLASLNASIHFVNSFNLQPLRVHDCALMERLIHSTQYGRKRLKRLNFCRLFLQVTFLSEIVNIDGTHLLPQFWCGLGPRPGRPLVVYPRQGCPSPEAWSDWRAAIRKAFCYPRSLRLIHPLGPWYDRPDVRYPSLTLCQTRLLLSTHESCYLQQQYPTHNQYSTAIQYHDVSHLPATPVKITRTSTCYLTTLPVHCPYPTPELYTISFLGSVSHWQHDLLQHLRVLCSREELIEHLTPASSFHCFGASDGGSTSHHSSFGWVLSSGLRDLVTCYGPVHSMSPTSYRAECVGFLSLLVFLHLTLPQAPMTDSLSVYLDSNSLISKVTSHTHRFYYSPSEATLPERDVMCQIESVIDALPCTLDLQHVPSHQDKHNPRHTLPPHVQANCRSDDLATHGLQVTSPGTLSPLFPAACCQLVLPTGTITHHIPHHLRQAAYEHSLRNHICQYYQWATTDVDWTVFGQLCVRTSTPIRFYLKWIHRLLPTGKLLHRRDSRESPFCPVCGQIEDNNHLLVCAHPSRQIHYRTIMSTLRHATSKMHTDPHLLTLLIDGVDSVFTTKTPSPASYPPAYRPLCHSQNQLGWISFLRGFISPEWRALEISYMDIHGIFPRRSLVFVLLSLWQNIHSLWIFRCSQRHSSDLTVLENESRRQAEQTITALYQQKNLVLPSDRHIFHSSLQEHLQDSLPDLQAWILNHQPYIHHSISQARHDNTTHTLPISDYFPPD